MGLLECITLIFSPDTKSESRKNCCHYKEMWDNHHNLSPHLVSVEALIVSTRTSSPSSKKSNLEKTVLGSGFSNVSISFVEWHLLNLDKMGLVDELVAKY
jgi:hypothetical protein